MDLTLDFDLSKQIDTSGGRICTTLKNATITVDGKTFFAAEMKEIPSKNVPSEVSPQPRETICHGHLHHSTEGESVDERKATSTNSPQEEVRSITATSAIVRFEVPGFHYWPLAPENRSYLSYPHRHLFKVEVEMEVRHEEREIEYHDLLDFCKGHFPGGDMGTQSCETMARTLATKIAVRYPKRQITVSIFEDGEVGARFHMWPYHSFVKE